MAACSTTADDDGAPRAGDLRIVATDDDPSRAGGQIEAAPPSPVPSPAAPRDPGDGLGQTPPPPPIPQASCEADADCVRIERGCCALGDYIAVHRDKAAVYEASLACSEPIPCPLIKVVDDHSMAECNWETHACELVQAKDVACNGFSRNPHVCPDGFQCILRRDIADVPGTCVQQCGGFGGFPCDDPDARCIDDPADDCDPKRGGADCGGLCIGPGAH